MNILDSFIAYLVQNPKDAGNKLQLAALIVEFIMDGYNNGKVVTTESILNKFSDYPQINYLRELASQMELLK